MSIFGKITINTLIATLARIIDTVLALVLVVLLTRHLGTEGYGFYTTIIAYVHIFISLANLGLYNILLRDIGKEGIDEEKITSNIFTLRLVGLVLFLPISILIVFIFPYPSMVRIGIAIATIATLFLSLYQILVPIFQKHLKIIYVSFAELINRIIYVGLAAFFLLKIKTGLIPIMWAMAISALVNFLLVFYFARRFDKIRLRFNWARWKKILREALPVGASIIFTLIYFRIDTIMLSLMKAPQDVGIYGLSYKILENLIFFPAMFVGFVVPILSRYVFKKIDKFKKVFQLSLNAILLAAIPLVAALIIAAPLIITFLAGEAFIASSKVLQILAIAVGFIFLGSLYGQTVIIVKKQFWSMWVYLAGAVFNVLANLYFIPRYSYIGAAITTALTEFIITLALIIIVSKTLHYHASFKIGIKAIAATLPMAVFLYYFQNLHIIILAILSILIYAFFIYLLRGISKEDFSLLSKKTAP
jgi:O-antigen/teichoic acid export membrane protein